MKSLSIFLLVVLLWLPSPCAAEEPNVPPIVVKGFEEFQRNGTLAAMGVWFAGSARENDDDQERASGRMTSIQGLFGRMLGYDVVRTVVLSPSTRRIYAAVKFEKGVAWMSFDCYKPDKDWIISRFDFGTSANLVLPPNILGGQ